MEDNNTTNIVYSYDRESINDEEAKKRYRAYMDKILSAMVEAQKKGGIRK